MFTQLPHPTLKDFIDIFLVATILYQLYRLIRGTRTTNIFISILSFFALGYLLTEFFDLELLGWLLNRVMSVGVILLVVIFQDEIRRFFFQIGARRKWGFLRQFERFTASFHTDALSSRSVMQVLTACRKMARTRTGALIVIQRTGSLDDYVRTGEVLNADINSLLIENIFFKNSPLHDGAMIIARDKIRAAGCILPVSHDLNIPKHLGLRHRSALGLAEHTDALTVIVSEETGQISVAENGQFHLNLTPEALEQLLSQKRDS